MLHDKSQDSTAKHLSCGELLHYKFIIQSAGEKKFKICKHLSKLQTKWLIASYAPFALDFCYQRCRTLQISKNFTEAIDQLGHVHLTPDKHTSTPPLVLQAGCPSCCPTNNVKALKAVVELKN